jgi:hypothetical protein
LTSAGFVDPIAFFRAVGSFLINPSEAHEFDSLITTQWPFLGQSASEIQASAETRLYPAPVLLEAKSRLALNGVDWGVIGILQKRLYWKRLLVSAGHSTSGPAFLFNISDLFNIFQLEAVIEFFLAWPEPESSTQPPPPNLPSGANRRVNLQTGWHMAIIDPFDHEFLGRPPLPKPEYNVKPYQFEGNCVESTALSTLDGTKRILPPDLYRGVLFLVLNGAIKGYYRWSTYSAHKWEDPTTNEAPFLSSVLGNCRYTFYSWTSSSLGVLNYGFRAFDPLLANERTGGRFYFQHPVKLDLDG